MQKINTLVVPIISDTFIENFINKLYKYTPNNFYLFVIDQTPNGIKLDQRIHFYIRPYRNLGFSKAMNTGIKLAQTSYITLCNDDVEFINEKWWQGILDTFEMDHHIIAVNPMSPKEGAWGYGLTSANKDTWVPPKEYYRCKDDPDSIAPLINGIEFTYDDAFTEEGYQALLKGHPRYKPETLVDAIAMWCTVFKKTGLDKIGLLDERFYPGGGEDYDMNARAYSCAWPIERQECDLEYHYRMVSTTKSWVWHHWGKSKNLRLKNPSDTLFSSRSAWNDNGELWPQGFDCWGHENKNGKKIPYIRLKEVFIDAI